MKTKKLIRTFLIVLAVAAGSIALAACDNSFGVFHEIQTEKAQVGTDVFKNVTVKAIAEDGSNYYAAMAKVFYRPTGGDTWLVLPVNSDTDYYCSGLASTGAGTIYVAATDTSTTALKGIFSTSDSGANWNKMSDAEFDGKIVDALFYVNGTLFATSHTDTESSDTFYLYYWDTATSNFLPATFPSALDIPITGLVYGGSAYWAMTSSALYTSSASPFNFVADSTSGTPSSAKTLCGIATDSSADVLVTTSDGYLYTYAASAWSSDLLASSVKLGVLAEVPIDDAASAYRLLVAKHNSSYGYYEYNAATQDDPLSGNDGDAIFSPTASSYTTTIYLKPVMAFHYSTANKTLLIGMAAQGTDTYALYSNTVTGSDWSGWTAE
ncbi:MAG TPA: hypothetical protein VN445_07090 [Rectinemataceae bacterium]|nr:hypothetical protein [Rectinemataceae bacterium]